jgi:hypothetical protein
MPVFKTASFLRSASRSNSNVTLGSPTHQIDLRPSQSILAFWLGAKYIYVAVVALVAFLLVRLTFMRIAARTSHDELRKARGTATSALAKESEKRESYENHLDYTRAIREGDESAVNGEVLDRLHDSTTNGRSSAPTNTPSARSAATRAQVVAAGALPLASLLKAAGLQQEVQGQACLAADWDFGRLLMDGSSSRNESDAGSRGVSARNSAAAGSSSSRSGSDSGTRRNGSRRIRSNTNHRHHQHGASASSSSRQPLAYDFAALRISSQPSEVEEAKDDRSRYSAAGAEDRAAHSPATTRPVAYQTNNSTTRGYPWPSPDLDGRHPPSLFANMSRDGYVATERITVPPLLPPLSMTTMSGSPVESVTRAFHDFDLASPPFSRRRHARQPPLPPVTAPTLATTAYTFEDRRPSYAVSIPPELEFDAAADASSVDYVQHSNPADQANPADFFDTTADDVATASYVPYYQEVEGDSPTTATASTTSRQRTSPPRSSAGPRPSRRRSYTRAQPVGIPAPVVFASHQDSSSSSAAAGAAAAGGETDFAPSSYPPASPRLPPPPPGWELDGIDYELYEGTEEIISPWDGDEYQEGDEEEFQPAVVAGPSASSSRHDSHAHRERRQVDVQGEIISAIDGSGSGWKRHTRVYGGGVCLACAASGSGEGHGSGHGGVYGENVRRPKEGKRSEGKRSGK